MRQLVQSVRSGALRIVDGPDPTIGPTEVLVEVTRSLVSAGTERAVRELASKNLLQKARARPDLVREVMRRARQDGMRATLGAVRTRLDDEMPLGYSAAGRVVAVGEAVAGVRPGMRVATGGAGHGATCRWSLVCWRCRSLTRSPMSRLPSRQLLRLRCTASVWPTSDLVARSAW